MDKLEEKINDVKNQLCKIDDVLDDMNNISNKYDDKQIIKDYDNFYWKLSIDGRFNTEDVEKIKSFITEYLNFYNK